MWTTCSLCGAPSGTLCEPCRAGLLPAPIGPPGHPIAGFEYNDAVRSLILGTKLRGRRDLAAPLVEGMVSAVYKTGLVAEVVTWVPGRTPDVRRRGFDHAALLARGFGDRLGMPCVGLLYRVRAVRDQSELARAARRSNVAGAFGAHPCPERVVLVDDLVTTGATAAACCRALSIAGARSIEVVAAARA